MATSSDQTTSSSPRLKSEITFSDAATRCSTPPSSPPGFPWEQEEQDDAPPCKKPAPPPKQTTIMNAFTVLGKRKPLSETTPNPRPRKQLALPPKQPTTATPQPSQTQLSLGQQTRTKCTACGMEYVKSSSEDRNLHAKYHVQNLSGYDVGDTFVASTLPHRRMPGLRPTDDAIIQVTSADPHHRKRRAHAALEIVQRELGAVDIPHDDLWKLNPNEESTQGGEPRYRAYMYIRGRKCVGYLLVERLDSAFAVLDPSPTIPTNPEPSDPQDPKSTKNKPKKISALAALRARKAALTSSLPSISSSEPLRLSTTPSPAVLGISRIWTSPTHRGQNIASALLDAAVKWHNDCVERARKPALISGNIAGNLTDERSAVVRREEVAFSQPTEAGARLARRWTGRAYGWLVYA